MESAGKSQDDSKVEMPGRQLVMWNQSSRRSGCEAG